MLNDLLFKILLNRIKEIFIVKLVIFANEYLLEM